MIKSSDLVGRVFGRLTVVSEAAPRGKYHYLLCLCECGKHKEVYKSSLTRGVTGSCGCAFKEQLSDRITTHGMSKTPTYKSWKSMLGRCKNPKDEGYKNYGGRGITVAPEWEEFSRFLLDMGERPENTTLERLNNDQGYSKANCVWATKRAQARNRRSNINVLWKGETKTLTEWCEILGKPYATVRARLVNGWSTDKAFTTL